MVLYEATAFYSKGYNIIKVVFHNVKNVGGQSLHNNM